MSHPPAPSIEGKTILITGANSGLGFVSAEKLASRGAEILLVCRTLDKAESTRDAIARTTGNNRLHCYGADLRSQTQIRELGDRVLIRHPRLHVLLNNAGLLLGQRQTTEDGFETTFAVNHLAPFLLTRLLMDRLLESAPARIVNVSSMVHNWGELHFEDLQMKEPYRPLAAYYQSKLANVLFTYALARRLGTSGVTANCLHPGMVNTPFGKEGSLFYKLAKAIARPVFYIPPERGAATQVWLSSAPEVATLTGKYFVGKRAVGSSALSYREELQERLWTVSEKMCGLEPWPPQTGSGGSGD